MTYPQIVLAVLGVIVCLTLVVAATISGTAFGFYNPNWEGSAELRSEAENLGTETIVLESTAEYKRLEANGSIAFIVGPEEQYDSEDTENLNSFLERGGTVVVADERVEIANPLLNDLNATSRIDGDPLRDERNYYRSPAIPEATETGDHPYVDNIDAVTLNHGSAVEPGNATTIVNSSPFAYLDANRNEQLDTDETLGTYPVVTVEEIGDGELVVVSDASVFINVMMERTDNREFARSMIADHERVVLDLSHGESVPLLVTATMAFRESTVLQLLVGVGVISILGLWQAGRFDLIADVVRHRVSGLQPDSEPTERTLAQSEIDQSLTDRLPEEDRTQLDRATTGVMSRDDEHQDDDGSGTSLRADSRGGLDGTDR